MKRILSSLMAALLIVFMFSITVSASQISREDIVSLVNGTNASIEQEIAKAQTQANILTTKYDVTLNILEKIQQRLRNNDQAYAINLKLAEQSKLWYENELDRIVNNLTQRTDSIAGKTISIADENGYNVTCEMVDVQLGNRVVSIDPLRVSDI